MTDSSNPGIGGVPSADIAVPDHARELQFYARVLTTGPRPLWRPDLMNAHGTPIIGLGSRTAEYASLPLQWMPHVQVADVAESAARARDLGGRELMHGRDDDGTSQWAGLLDPGGAAFGLIPAPPTDGATTSPPDGSAGRIAGLSLTTADLATTREFYQRVIGWSVRDDSDHEPPAPDAPAIMLGDDGRPVATIGPTPASVDPVPPPVWMIHLPVGDLPESLRRVAEQGGAVMMTTEGHDGTPERAVIRDPVGAHLALVAN